MKTLVITPTFNERQNIAPFIRAILQQNIPELEILVVDDNSPDGTGEVVRKIEKRNKNVHLMSREKKMGLGTAYVAGFKYALKEGFERIIEMDADFSHDPKDIRRLLEASETADIVIGSRYIDGVNVVNWPLRRLLLSLFANRYTRIITGLPIRDCTAGFKCFHRNVLEDIDLDAIESDGYSFQIEMNFRAHHKGFKIVEIPIVFIDRAAGASKMSKRIVREAIWMVWRLKFKSWMGKL
ncbi:polyprenol monophosphomannose synthase [candidate division KSB1 bacterium]|nr:polyprenol monophosphomannose synthase [candidate division KSB1 bacterium]